MSLLTRKEIEMEDMIINNPREYQQFLAWLSSYDIPKFNTMYIKLVEGILTARMLTPYPEHEIIDLIPKYKQYLEMVSILDADL